jgi:hypothetical protein
MAFPDRPRAPTSTMTSAAIGSLVHGIETGLKHESEKIYRADIVPAGEPPAPP